MQQRASHKPSKRHMQDMARGDVQPNFAQSTKGVQKKGSRAFEMCKHFFAMQDALNRAHQAPAPPNLASSTPSLPMVDVANRQKGVENGLQRFLTSPTLKPRGM